MPGGSGDPVLMTPDSRLVVTYRAIPRHVPLLMAGDAETHAIHVVHLEHLGHPLHVPVAGGACVGTERLDVSLVWEVGVPGEIVNADPFDRLLLAPGLAQLPDFRLMRAVSPADDQVTSHTGLNRRDAGLRRDRDRVMAVLALDLVLTRVDVVAKEDWLPRTRKAAGVRCRNDGSTDGVW